MSFSKGFKKTASPEWFKNLHKGIPAGTRITAQSKKGLKGLLIRRGIK